MIATWIVVSVILVMALLAAGFTILMQGDIDFSDKEDRYIFFGLGTLLLFGAFLWPVALVLAVPVALCYGLYSLVRLAGMRRRGEL